MHISKIVSFLKPAYASHSDDALVDLAIRLDERKALGINPNTGAIAIVDAVAVRELAPELLRSVQLPTVPDDADFDAKLANAAERFRALGLDPDIGGGGDGALPFDPADLAKIGGAS